MSKTKDEFDGVWMEYYHCLACQRDFMFPQNNVDYFCCWCLNFDRIKMQLLQRVKGSYELNDNFERESNLGLLEHAQRTYSSMERCKAPREDLNEMLDIMAARSRIKKFWDSNQHPTEEEYDAFYYQKDLVRYCTFPTETDKRYIKACKNQRKQKN